RRLRAGVSRTCWTASTPACARARPEPAQRPALSVVATRLVSSRRRRDERDNAMTSIDHTHPILVLGGTGTVGGRVVRQLREQGVPVRPASRHTDPRFDYDDPGTWDAVLDGVRRAYLLLPDDVGLPAGFVERLAAAGVERVVLHSDRGVEVMGVTRLLEAEAAVRRFPEWTIVRADWFDQNFETF